MSLSRRKEDPHSKTSEIFVDCNSHPRGMREYTKVRLTFEYENGKNEINTKNTKTQRRMTTLSFVLTVYL